MDSMGRVSLMSNRGPSRPVLLLLAPLALALLMLLAEPASGFEVDALPGWLGDTYRSTPEPKPAAGEPEPGLSEPRIVRLSWKPRRTPKWSGQQCWLTMAPVLSTTTGPALVASSILP
ncbi:unnamed protein product, partial [Closterium sp. NIES-54]